MGCSSSVEFTRLKTRARRSLPSAYPRGVPPTPTQIQRFRSLARFLVLMGIVYGSGLGTQALGQRGTLIPCYWIEAGVILVAVFRYGRSLLAAAWLGLLFAFAQYHFPWGVSAGLATSGALGVWVAVELFRTWKLDPTLGRPIDLGVFLVGGSVLGMGVASLGSALVLWIKHPQTLSEILRVWGIRWWWDGMGVLLLGIPLLLSTAPKGSPDSRKGQPNRGSRSELLLAWAALTVITLVVVSPVYDVSEVLPDLLVLPFLMWIGLRGSLLQASWAIAGVTAALIWQILANVGMQRSALPALDQLGAMSLMATMSIITLLTSVMQDEEGRVKAVVARELESWSQTALESLPVPVMCVGGDQKIVFINTAFTNLFGYCYEDLPDFQSWTRKACLEPTEGAASEWRWQQVWETGLDLPWTQVQVRTKQGTLRKVILSAHLMGDRAISTFMDVTAQEAYEQEIERLNRILTTLSQVNQALVRSASREGILKEVCAIATKYGGFSLAWIGWVEPPTGRVQVVALAGEAEGYLEGIEVFATDRPEGRGPVGTSIREGRTMICHDIRMDSMMAPWKDKAEAWGFRSLMSVPIREEGEIRGSLAIYSREPNVFHERESELLEEMAIDISFALDNLAKEEERKRTQASLLESEQRLRLTLDSTGIGLVDWNLKTGTWHATPAYFQIMGDDPQQGAQSMGEWMHRIHPDDQGRARAIVEKVSEGRDLEFNIELRIRHRDGSYRWVNNIGHAVEFDEDGRATRLLSVRIDITHRMNLEQDLRQAQKLEALGQLAGGVAHDFNNILGAITGFAGLVELKLAPDDPIHHEIEQIQKAAQRGAALTQALLAFGRRQIVHMEPQNLSQIVSGFEKFLRRLIPEDITLEVHLTKPALPIVADRNQLEQVLMNLVANARDAMPHGGAMIIRAGSVARGPSSANPGAYAELSVADTGSGIPENIRSKIFDPFFTTKEPGKGTGLGLAMVFGIVERHGGFIELQSSPEEGTTFRIYLPLAAQTEDSDSAPKVVAPLPKGTETILLAEDDPSLRNATAGILKAHGYRVIEASDGLEAVDHYTRSQHPIHLVILDGIMPRMDGHEAWLELQAQDLNLKALFVSGYAEDVFAHQGVLSERVAFLPKPYKSDVLIRKVREILDEGKS